MKKKYITGLILTASFILSGCGKGNAMPEPGRQEQPASVEAETEKSDASENTEQEEPDDTERNEPDTSGDICASYTAALKYILENGADKAVFSPESLKTALALHSTLMTEESREEVLASIGDRDYLAYESNETFKTVNRLWINSNKDIHTENIKDESAQKVICEIDMSDSEKATQEKNDYVAGQTNGFITSTPTVFNNDVGFDSMNVIYFKDIWRNGDKTVDDEKSDFHNDNGTVGKALMFHDDGERYYYDGKAHACEMRYENGFLCMVILPDEGYGIEDIDLDTFVNRDAEVSRGDWTMTIPEFETETTYQALPGAEGEIDPAIYDGDYKTGISQIAKIKFDHTGTEAAAVTEILMTTTAMPPQEQDPPFDFVCDKPFVYCIMDTLNDDVAFICVLRSFPAS